MHTPNDAVVYACHMQLGRIACGRTGYNRELLCTPAA